jgi:hypothetical protein
MQAEPGIRQAAKLATRRQYPNPREVTVDSMIELLSRATEGLPIEATR